MFLDSMENGMASLNNQSTLNGIKTATNDLNSSLGSKNPNRKMLKVQISEDRIEHRIQEESDETVSERLQRGIQMKNDSVNGHRNESISNFEYPSAKLDTQSMNEMEELRQLYHRNLYDDNTNTNTFNLNNNNNNNIKSSSQLNNDINLTESLNEALKSQYERERELFRLKNEFAKNDSTRYSLLDTHSQVVLDTDLMENIKDELEKRALSAIMKDLTLSQESKKKPLYSNNKYKNVKSSGYGRATPKKSLDVRESHNNSNVSKSYLTLEGLSAKDNSFIDNYITENMKLSNKISELIRERDEDRELLILMKGKER